MSEQPPVFPSYQPPAPQGVPIDTANMKGPLTKLINRMWNPKKISRSKVHITHRKPKKKAGFY